MKDVKEIQRLGGTVLGSSRGGFDKDKIVDNLISHGITHVRREKGLSELSVTWLQIYCLGGDGTHRGI